MERLVAISPSGDLYYPKYFERCTGDPNPNDCMTCPLDDEIAEKLAAYEDKDEQEQERNVIFRRALDTYGAERQTRKLFEEVAEMQEALCKCTDGRDTVHHLAEEIADVHNMLIQMAILHDCVDEVEDFKRVKIKRLEKRLESDCARD